MELIERTQKNPQKKQSISKDAKTFFDTNSCALTQLEAQIPCF